MCYECSDAACHGNARVFSIVCNSCSVAFLTRSTFSRMLPVGVGWHASDAEKILLNAEAAAHALRAVLCPTHHDLCEAPWCLSRNFYFLTLSSSCRDYRQFLCSVCVGRKRRVHNNKASSCVLKVASYCTALTCPSEDARLPSVGITIPMRQRGFAVALMGAERTGFNEHTFRTGEHASYT